jgi:hypothetical protein
MWALVLMAALARIRSHYMRPYRRGRNAGDALTSGFQAAKACIAKTNKTASSALIHHTSIWRQQHHDLLLNATAPFRTCKVHRWAGWGGPWIENIFIQTFIHKELSTFGAFIPLFVPWTDCWIEHGWSSERIADRLLPFLRSDVAYIAISQNDRGILPGIDLSIIPSVVVLSSGGYGHVALPLIKGPPPAHWNTSFPSVDRAPRFVLSFAGDAGTAPQQMRIRMLTEIRQLASKFNISVSLARKLDALAYTRLMKESTVSLAPRGYGRSSFRFTEVFAVSKHLSLSLLCFAPDYSSRSYSAVHLGRRSLGSLSSIQG